MELPIDLFLHVDRHLAELVARHGAWVYGILFLVVFAETGLVVMPFLPGDSLLFAAGAVAITAGSQINGALVGRFRPEQILSGAVAVGVRTSNLRIRSSAVDSMAASSRTSPRAKGAL